MSAPSQSEEEEGEDSSTSDLEGEIFDLSTEIDPTESLSLLKKPYLKAALHRRDKKTKEQERGRAKEGEEEEGGDKIDDLPLQRCEHEGYYTSQTQCSYTWQALGPDLSWNRTMVHIS